MAGPCSPKHGVTETRAEVDGAVIREAAGRAVILWPEEPSPSPALPGAATR